MNFTILSESNPVSRKSYACSLCGLPIQIGEKYFRQNAIFDGKMETYTDHLECREVTDDWTIDDWESPADPEMFREHCLVEYRAEKGRSHE